MVWPVRSAFSRANRRLMSPLPLMILQKIQEAAILQIELLRGLQLQMPRVFT